MKRLLTTASIAAALMLPGVVMADLSPEEKAKADQIREARTAARLALQTKASKAEYDKIVKTLDKKVPGRSCDADDWMLSCAMEDGTSVSVEAVPLNTSEAKAAELCTNPYADASDAGAKTKVELKGNLKQGFLMLWCTVEARGRSLAAAEKRKKWAAEPAASPVTTSPNFAISYGKKMHSYGQSRQPISIKNNTGAAQQQMFIECGFFLNGQLVGTGLGGVGNLMPGATKHTSIIGLDIQKFDKAECSVKD